MGSHDAPTLTVFYGHTQLNTFSHDSPNPSRTNPEAHSVHVPPEEVAVSACSGVTQAAHDMSQPLHGSSWNAESVVMFADATSQS